LRDSGGHPIAPYDVTAHTLPLLMGIEVQPVLAPFKPSVIRKVEVTYDIKDCLSGGPKSIALYKSHVPSMDEGWTKWALESSCEQYEEITDEDIRRGNFEQKHRRRSPPSKETKYSTIIIPDQAPRSILNGYRQGTMPPELTGGLGEAGVKALREFVEQGGTLVTLNEASGFAIEALKLPVRDVTAGLKRTEYYAPGSILRTELDTSHPIAAGLPRESVAWVEDSPVFELTDSPDAARARIIARYPASADSLLSGWLLGGERLKGKAALVEVKVGQGHVYLFGFRPQYRGQSLATYPLFFNALRARAD
jgi:ribosomal protein S18 acetylase RimI-like enzyme